MPDGYTKDRCWPVLYLLHSASNPREYLASADVLTQQKTIIVIPSGGNGMWANWWNAGKLTPRWESWFFDELVTKVESSFNICDDRSQRAIAGTSMGGYGATLYGALRPDYFGTVGSFSGMISLGHKVMQFGYNEFDEIFGRPGGFYQHGHDPVKLVGNLKSTRMYVTHGDGNPTDADDGQGQGRVVELVAGMFAGDFVPAARKAKLKLTYETHRGMHTASNFRNELIAMLKWNPFGKVTKRPKTWTYQTVARSGKAWDFGFKFTKQPRTVITFDYARDRLDVLGKGRMTLAPLGGGKVTATLPFSYRDGVVRPIKNGKVTKTKEDRLPVALYLKPWNGSMTQPVKVTFKTDRKLKPTQTYQVIWRQVGGDCYVTNEARAYQPKKGKIVTVTLKPGKTPGHPANRWCPGRGKIHLLVVPKASQGVQLGDYIGLAAFKLKSGARRGS